MTEAEQSGLKQDLVNLQSLIDAGVKAGLFVTGKDVMTIQQSYNNVKTYLYSLADLPPDKENNA